MFARYYQKRLCVLLVRKWRSNIYFFMEHCLVMLERELKIRNYSRRTVSIYSYCVKGYLLNLGGKSVFGEDEVADCVKDFLAQKYDAGLSSSTVNLYLSAIKFFYKNVLNVSFKVNIKFAKRRKRLPVLLGKSEILRIINSIQNRKYVLMVSLAYGSGMRIGEILSLRVKDFDFCSMFIRIREGKGNKDRITILPLKLKGELEEFFSYKNGEEYAFPSRRGGKLSSRTLQKVFERALLKCGLPEKGATFHSLRHSFATHLLENGVDLRYLRDLLGHKDIKTTQIYASVTMDGIRRISSPL